MTAPPLWVFGWATPDNLGDWVVKLLAVAGGVLVGGVGSGLLLQLLVRLTTAGRVPKWILQVVRVLGAVIGGWIVAMFVFGSGTGTGMGWGGGGGTGTGPEGTGRGTGAEPRAREEPGPQETAPERGTARAAPDRTLRVDGLVDRRNNTTAFRLQGQQDLLSLDDLEKYVRSRREQAPALQRLELVLYRNSPDRDSGPVKELLAWAQREGLETSIDTPATNAP
jgi:hypothetical protein